MSDNLEIEEDVRYDWKLSEVLDLFKLEFNDLIYRSHCLHRKYFDVNKIQLSTLYNVKVGGCPEDCNYCAQSSYSSSGVEAKKMADLEEVLAVAQKAKASGASRFCMSAAWRNPKDRDLPKIKEMISKVKSLGLETCTTLGMLTKEQAQELKQAGLDYYNHNIDTSRDYYKNITTTRNYDDRLTTLSNVSDSGIKLCTGGIVGMGESVEDRANMLLTLSSLPKHPQSIPINMLVPIEGTPLEKQEPIDSFEVIRTIAVARILMPKSFVRLSAGRVSMDQSTQALCFFAGANSTFLGDKLLTTSNPELDEDAKLFSKLGLKTYEHREGSFEL